MCQFRGCCLTVVLSVALLACPFALAADPANKGAGQKQTDLKWAREIAEHFFDNMISGDHKEALAVATEAFQKRHTHWLDLHIPDFTKFVIEGEAISPEGDEARLTGFLDGRQEVRLAFSLVVIKERESRKWRVNSFATFQNQP